MTAEDETHLPPANDAGDRRVPTGARGELLAHLASEPWALLPQTLGQLVMRLAAEPDLEWAATFTRKPGPMAKAGSIAVIPVHGFIENRATPFDRYFGVTSLERLAADLRSAMEDADVKAIVFDVESPGGSAAGVQEFAAAIRAARGQGKPIIAHANAMAASAAYWIASAADELVMTPSASVGSIGVITVHQEYSRMLEAEGIGTTVISSGEFKAEITPFAPLSDEARAYLQERSDAIHQRFMADVAKGRNTTVENVRASFGKGRMVMAPTAQAVGMVDRVETFEATILRLSRALGGAQPVVSERAEADLLEEEAATLVPFGERVAALGREAQAVAEHGTTRAELRAKENTLRSKDGRQPRPLLSTDAITALRASRDAITALLATVEPGSGAGPAVTPVQPAPSSAEATPRSQVLAKPPVISREDFLQKLKER